MRIIFFGTANVALPILEELRLEHDIVAVVTTPDVKVGRKQILQESPVSALAKDLNLTTYKPEKIKNNPEFLKILTDLAADIFVVVAYGKILPMAVINLPPHKTVNVHFSLLPKYRGPSPIQAALLAGDTHTGSSIFVLDEGVDTGPLIAQEILAVEPDDNFFTLSDKLARFSAKLILPTLEDYTGGKITPLPQVEEGISQTKIISKVDGKADWNQSAAEIYNRFRAFYIWPGLWSTWQGKTLKITDCRPVDIQALKDVAVGSILDGGIVACGQNTALQISSLQLEGKTEVAIMDFLNGYKNFVGSRLE